MYTVKLHIAGKVQGVWYRASAKDAALALDIKGAVWNNPDGSVGAIGQAGKEQIARFIDWCRQGPPLSVVSDVSFEEVKTAVVFNQFQITKTEPVL